MTGGAASVKSIDLRNGGFGESNVSSIALLFGKFENLLAIDVSDNVSLGMSGLGRLVSCCAGEVLLFVIT